MFGKTLGDKDPVGVGKWQTRGTTSADADEEHILSPEAQTCSSMLDILIASGRLEIIAMTETKRQRRRPAVYVGIPRLWLALITRKYSSCSLCRRRKIRCDREAPCGSCLRSGNTSSCVYEGHSPLLPRRHVRQDEGSEYGLAQKSRAPKPSSQGSSISRNSAVPSDPSSPPPAAGSTRTSTLASQSSAPDVEALKSQIRKLEEQLSNATSGHTQTPASTLNSSVGGTFYIHYESPATGQPHAIARSVTHKRRLFGQSHWINGLVLVSPRTTRPAPLDSQVTY
jgi:hypothetical protein